jgi:hypothetical protein
MPKTTFTFRISEKARQNLLPVAKAYGMPPTSFVGEMVDVIVCADMERLTAFLGRLQTGMARQLVLELGKAEKRQKRRRRASSG